MGMGGCCLIHFPQQKLDFQLPLLHSVSPKSTTKTASLPLRMWAEEGSSSKGQATEGAVHILFV